jgi:hypothetical protein
MTLSASDYQVAWAPPTNTWWMRGSHRFRVMGLIQRVHPDGSVRTEAVDSHGKNHLVGPEVIPGAGKLIAM